jgi:hypothetical protein
VNNNKEEFFVIEGTEVQVFESNVNFNANPTHSNTLAIVQNPPPTGVSEKRGVCITTDQEIYFGLATLHVYDGTSVT